MMWPWRTRPRRSRLAAAPAVPPGPDADRRLVRGIASAAEWLFGLASLLVGLSTLAALPLVQFLSLGYLLESSARVARSGRLRDGFIGVRRAARVGGIAAGIWLATVPAWLVGTVARSAELIDPGGRAARGWRAGLIVAGRPHGLPRPGGLRPRRPAAALPLAVRPSFLADPPAPRGRPVRRVARRLLGVRWPRCGCRITSGSGSSASSARSPG